MSFKPPVGLKLMKSLFINLVPVGNDLMIFLHPPSFSVSDSTSHSKTKATSTLEPKSSIFCQTPDFHWIFIFVSVMIVTNSFRLVRADDDTTPFRQVMKHRWSRVRTNSFKRRLDT